jgi:hypothetical protein
MKFDRSDAACLYALSAAAAFFLVYIYQSLQISFQSFRGAGFHGKTVEAMPTHDGQVKSEDIFFYDGNP